MSHDRQPVLSVVTVVRNGEQHIGRCIESVIAQGIQGLEYIIVDGQSTDGTLEVIERYRDSVSVLISEPDKGLYDAMNKGLRLATGRFIHFLNSDDQYFDDGVLARILPELMDGEVVFGQMKYVEADGSSRLIGQPFSWDEELRASRVPQMALVVPKSCYAEVGEFDLSLRIAADYDMVLRLASKFPMRYLPVPISVMHAGGISYLSPKLAFRESMQVARRYGRGLLPGYGDYYLKRIKWQLSRMLPQVLLGYVRERKEASRSPCR